MRFFKTYQRKDSTREMRPYVVGEDLAGVSISDADRANGSPKEGDFIARNSNNHGDLWLVSAEYFADKFHPEPTE